jgi:hypothetical protein
LLFFLVLSQQEFLKPFHRRDWKYHCCSLLRVSTLSTLYFALTLIVLRCLKYGFLRCPLYKARLDFGLFVTWLFPESFGNTKILDSVMRNLTG